MASHPPALQHLIDQVNQARASGKALCIRGGGSKDFYGQVPVGERLDTRGLQGTLSYEPSELVVTARAGTPLAELEALLAEQGQCLPFEPPHFGPSDHNLLARGATVGGMVAAGLSGPARASAGAVRDHVLGATLLNGRGEVLSFDGQVAKNMAGYDVSRLMAGSLGTLGVLLEVSLKVLPMAPATLTLRMEMDSAQAIAQLNTWSSWALPVNASAWWDGNLVLRLRSTLAAVQAARTRLGGEAVAPSLARSFWQGLRDHHDEFFVKAHVALQSGAALWRISVPPTTAPLPLSGELMMEWGGAQRWLCTATPAGTVRQVAAEAGGHATLFAAQDKLAGVFAPLKPPLERIHRELKKSFDPAGIFNPGRLYPGL
jgi:glycolate oxidase FAD binding subunit